MKLYPAKASTVCPACGETLNFELAFTTTPGKARKGQAVLNVHITPEATEAALAPIREHVERHLAASE